MTKLDLRDAVLIGHSMGTGEVTRYLSEFGSDRISNAVFISPIPPFLLKTADNPDGIDRSVFDGFVQAIAADRPAYQTQFLSDFYNLDETLGTRVSEDAVQASWNVAVKASAIGTSASKPAWLMDLRNDLPRIDVPSLIFRERRPRFDL